VLRVSVGVCLSQRCLRRGGEIMERDSETSLNPTSDALRLPTEWAAHVWMWGGHTRGPVSSFVGVPRLCKLCNPRNSVDGNVDFKDKEMKKQNPLWSLNYTFYCCAPCEHRAPQSVGFGSVASVVFKCVKVMTL